jgi:phage nucleotide-binding protein
MPVQITKTTDNKVPSLVMCLYGQGGVGKTTLATTAPKPIFIDSEDGTKALGARGINVPVIHVRSWADVQEAWTSVKDDKSFETVVIDPIDKFLDLLIDAEKSGGEMNIKKWGSVKDRMRKFIWAVKSSGKHALFVAHETKDKDDEQQIRSPKLGVNLSSEIVDLCDVVGHLRISNDGKRSLRVQPEQKYEAKDRFDALGTLVELPNISDMIKKIHESYTKPPFEDKKK